MPTINDIRRRSAALLDTPLGTADKAEPEHFTSKRILAYFQPESWTDGAPLDTASVPLGVGREIDVTREVLSLSVADIHALEDDTDSTNDLLDAMELGHQGPHSVAVTERVKAFFDVARLSEITHGQLDAARRAAGVAQKAPVRQSVVLQVPIKTESAASPEEIATIVQTLIDVGVADAHSTLEDKEGDLEGARLATDLEFGKVNVLGARMLIGPQDVYGSPAAADQEIQPPRWLVGERDHTWSWNEDGRMEVKCRVVIEVANEKLVAAQVWGYKRWEEATADQSGDLAKALFVDNRVCDDPQSFDLFAIDRLPAWAVPAAGEQQQPAYQNDEVIGLDNDGHVVQWNSDNDIPVNSRESLEKFGLHNLRRHELARVGVDREAWEAAVAAQAGKLPEFRVPSPADANAVDAQQNLTDALYDAFERGGGSGHDLPLAALTTVLATWEQIRTPGRVEELSALVSSALGEAESDEGAPSPRM